MLQQLDLFTLPDSNLSAEITYDTDYNLIRTRYGKTPWSWEGLGRFEGTYSERQFATRAETEADAKATLTQETHPI